MRIRKQPRQLPACRDSFLPCSFQEGVGWSDHRGYGGAVMVEKAREHNGERIVAGMSSDNVGASIDHGVKCEPDVIAMSRMPGHVQSGDGHVVQDVSQQLLLPGGMQNGMLVTSMSGVDLAGTSQMGLVASSPARDSEITSNGDQMKLPARSNHLESSFTQEEDDEENLTRHYVRRGLRNSGDSVTHNQSAGDIPVEDVVAAIPKTNSYECGRFLYSEKKANLVSRRRTTQNRYMTRSAIPCIGNEDDDHPSREPEGSLLHSLYLQLLAAGREGISLRSLFTSFESQTSLPRLASNWREQVKAHLKSGPYFEEVKGRYLLCEFLVQPLRRNTKRKGSSESLGVQTRRKAYQKTYEAVLCESAMEFQKLQYQKDNGGGSDTPSPSMLRSESTESDELDITNATPTRSISASIRNSSKSRRPKSDDDGFLMTRNIRYGGAIPGSLKAMQAKIIAETGVQRGVRCARKDGSNDSSKWQCPMMAMDGHSLCEHHSFLNERKRARYQKARKYGDVSTTGKSPRSQFQEQSSTPRYDMKQCMNDDVTSLSAPESELDKSDSDDLTGLDEVASQALLTMKSDILAVESLHHQKESLPLADTNPVEVEYRPKPVYEEAPTTKSNPPQFFARSATGRFIAAKKTAVKIPSLPQETDTSLGKSNVPPTRPPSIPPLPAFYGPRRKTVKNRSLLSIS
ncbi:hypothetical protein KC19_7G030300 [Ceratodon purpureus]|uniref:WRC domain-containing protein n=1 Tax=Ceratodon purpureus TaxID=3225 RepID=A0A8T0H6S3_CERPU|nr:hypothetical protein KC19_7G030300 [Ceratodon purpureus]